MENINDNQNTIIETYETYETYIPTSYKILIGILTIIVILLAFKIYQLNLRVNELENYIKELKEITSLLF